MLTPRPIVGFSGTANSSFPAELRTGRSSAGIPAAQPAGAVTRRSSAGLTGFGRENAQNPPETGPLTSGAAWPLTVRAGVVTTGGGGSRAPRGAAQTTKTVCPDFPQWARSGAVDG